MLRLSRVILILHIRVETQTDAYRVLRDEIDRQRYILQFGDVDVVYDEQYNVYRVPAFADIIEKYTQAKLEHCLIYGSN